MTKYVSGMMYTFNLEAIKSTFVFKMQLWIAIIILIFQKEVDYGKRNK